MESLIRSRLEVSRKELLDLGLRNPLIHYRPSAARGVSVVQEHSATVFRQLVVQGKSLTFAAQPATQTLKNIGATASPALANHTDLKLQTTDTEEKLQQRLLNTYYTARTTLEEQGVNTLFLALGMLRWFEAEKGAEERRAPLMLVPVTLERSSARERFNITYTGEDLGGNLSIEAKLKTEFGIQLPELPEEEEFELDPYFDAIASAISLQPGWEVDKDRIELGFFSFGKYLLYNDLDKDTWNEDNQPVHHPLIQSLFAQGFQEPAPSVGEDAFLDDLPEVSDLLQVVDADSSQLQAMLAVHEGRNLVIQGPPGTGKSQTITNIIANALGHGKKVLFVAEKSAALEVVKRRLDALHLGEACLELHSHKANKKELHAELKRTLELGKPALQHLQQQVALLGQHRSELNAYSKAVNAELQHSGLSAHDVAGRLVQLYSEVEGLDIPRLFFPDITQWDATRFQQAESLASRIQAGLQTGSAPDRYLFWGSELQVLLPRQQTELATQLQVAAEATIGLQSACSHIAQQTSMDVPQNREASLALASALQFAADRPDLSGINITEKGWLSQQKQFAAILDAGKNLAALKEEYQGVLLPEAWNANVLPVRAELVAHGGKWYKFLIGSYKAAVRQLASLVVQTMPKAPETRLRYLDAILEVQRLEKQLADAQHLATRFFGAAWQGNLSNWQALAAANTYLNSLHASITAGKLPPQLLFYLSRNEPASHAKGLVALLLQKINDHGRALQELTAALAFNDGKRFAGATLLHQPLADQLVLLEAWKQRLPELQLVIAYNNLVDIASQENLSPLTELAAHWPLAHLWLKAVLQKTWFEHLLEVAVHKFPALRNFERSAHEAVMEQFRQQDVKLLHLNRARAALKHWEGLPSVEAGGQMNLLRTEFNKKARHKPIRKLMAEAGLAIQAIKPVFMMSPLSIANFLPPGSMEFDLVIFDEASQVRPVEALGALLRGKQLVVVGDSKQMPPTSFFDTLGQEGGDEESVTADLPSILSMCDAQGAPQRMLRWHYRSRHESLIRLSNQEFYENRLVVFPSAGSKTRAGLFFHHLPETVYDRGQTRTNPLEAEKVAAKVLEHVQQHPNQSLGVVAFSTAQRDAIQNQVELLRRQHPETEAFFSSGKPEPFFVKNLENVQGDERDVIFISIGYGRTKDGLVSQSFGPLNNEGGEKRLNVLITRARLRCEVFTNLTAEDIDTGKSASQGLRVLKNFLYFAQHGKLERNSVTQPEAENSSFVAAVTQQLVKSGYQVHQKVGASGFFIDMAIADPENPGKYVLGITCDGPSYHAARSARDRDRLRQQVLEAMGWTMHRIWSPDWLRNPIKELERLEQAINAAWKASLDAGDEEDEPVMETSLIREAIKTGSKLAPYQVAVLPPEIASAEMHQHPVGKVAKWLEKVVQEESPVHFDEVARRMVEAAGITRVGPRIRDHLKLAARFAEGSGTIRQKDEFIFSASEVPIKLRDRSALPPASRKWKYVAQEEVAGVLQKVVREAVAISPDDAFPLVAKLLGFARVTEEMRRDVLALIPTLVAQGLLSEEGDLLVTGKKG